MDNKPQDIKNILLSIINRQKENLDGLVVNSKTDFSRNRKLPYEKMVLSLLTMEGASLTNELLRQYGCDISAATAAAFVQQRKKLLPDAFEQLFKTFVSETDEGITYKGYQLLAIDGSDIQIATNLNDPDSLFQGREGSRPYNLLHLNALYDIMAHTYKDAVVFKPKAAGENKALVKMVDRSSISGKVIVIADRGYEAYNNMAHIQEKGWHYLIRIKDFQNYSSGILHGLILPEKNEFDEYIDLKLSRKQTNEMKALFKDRNHYRCIAHGKPFDYLPEKSRKADPAITYALPFRVVRFPITNDSYEVVVTNLDRDEFPPDVLKQLYAMRWGIETSFRDLKYTIGLLYFHSKKEEYILQEIFARLIMYNFSELITSHVVIEKKSRKHDYKVNFSVAVHICREFLLNKCIPPDIEAVIARYITPIRHGRSRPRDMKVKQAISFMYRIA